MILTIEQSGKKDAKALAEASRGSLFPPPGRFRCGRIPPYPFVMVGDGAHLLFPRGGQKVGRLTSHLRCWIQPQALIFLHQSG